MISRPVSRLNVQGKIDDMRRFALLTTIPGRDNTVGMPIYLLPLDLQHGLFVDETRGGTVTLPEVPGFALEIAPGSVTFPGGWMQPGPANRERLPPCLLQLPHRQALWQ